MEMEMEKKPAAFAIDLSDDRKTAKLSFGAAEGPHMVVMLEAEHVAGFIDALVRARADMHPEVRRSADGPVLVIPDPIYKTQVDTRSENMSLALRHPGLGWIDYQLPLEEVANLVRTWSTALASLQKTSGGKVH